MALAKVHPRLPQTSFGEQNTPKAGPTAIEPQELLESLRAKQKMYETLKSQGLIHHENPQNLEAEMARTIGELEELIAQLGEPK